MSTSDGGSPEPTGISRRDVLRRSAIVGGNLIWAVPLVQTVSSSAFAAGSPPPTHVKGVKHVKPPTEVLGEKKTLPFTGAEIAEMAVVGAGMVVGGSTVLDRTRRQRKRRRRVAAAAAAAGSAPAVEPPDLQTD